jgi:hypothetical protein
VILGDAGIMAHQTQHKGYPYFLFIFSWLPIHHQCRRHALRVIGWLDAEY